MGIDGGDKGGRKGVRAYGGACEAGEVRGGGAGHRRGMSSCVCTQISIANIDQKTFEQVLGILKELNYEVKEPPRLKKHADRHPRGEPGGLPRKARQQRAEHALPGSALPEDLQPADSYQ